MASLYSGSVQLRLLTIGTISFGSCLSANVSDRMFHDQRRFMDNIGNQTITMNKAELRDVYQKENDGGNG